MRESTTGTVLVLGASLALPSGSDRWGVVLGLTLVGTLAPLMLFYEGVSRLEASRVGVVSTLEPVTPTVVGGGVLVLGEVILVQRRGGLRRTVEFLRA